MSINESAQDERIRQALRSADEKDRLDVVAAVTGIDGGVPKLRRIMKSSGAIEFMDRAMLGVHLL